MYYLSLKPCTIQYTSIVVADSAMLDCNYAMMICYIFRSNPAQRLFDRIQLLGILKTQQFALKVASVECFEDHDIPI